MKDLLFCVHVVVSTLNLEISRCHLGDYVEDLCLLESSGESTHLPPMWPGFDSQTRRHMWIEFDGSLLCSERFSPGYSGFPLSS